MSERGPRFSGSRLGRWAARRIAQPFSERLGDYQLLSPPFSARQSVRNRKTGTGFGYRVRDKNDLFVANQMFVEEQYRTRGLRREPDIRARYDALVKAGKTPLIIDCGANIGLSAFYFRDQFPAARIIAVEPDPANFGLMSENLSSTGIVSVHAAVASTCRRGRMRDPGAGGCGMRVEDDASGAITFLSIDSLISEHGKGAEPFILKADIEGFEDDLFSGSPAWLDSFYLAMIELHDWMLPRSRSAQPFLKTVAPLDRDFLIRGENIFSISNRAPGDGL